MEYQPQPMKSAGEPISPRHNGRRSLPKTIQQRKIDGIIFSEETFSAGRKIMATPEVPLEHAHETIEHHAHTAAEPWVMGVALSAAILAAFAAVTALYAEHFATEATLEQIQASDRWTEFQANSIKEKLMEANKKLLKNLNKEFDPEDEAKLAEYKKRKEAVKDKAKEFEDESIKHLREHVPLSRGLTMFQVAIAICAISVLTKRRAFWFVSLAFGAIGVGFLIWGLVT